MLARINSALRFTKLLFRFQIHLLVFVGICCIHSPLLSEQEQESKKITISYAKFGEGRHHGRVEKFVEEAANKDNVISLLTSTGLKSKNPSGKPRPILRITYQVDGKSGTMDLKYGQRVNFRNVILEHAEKYATPQKKIEITYALFGRGSNKARCEEQVAAVASQVNIITPITTHGLSLRNPSGRPRPLLVLRYKVENTAGEMTLRYGQNVDLRKTILADLELKRLAKLHSIKPEILKEIGERLIIGKWTRSDGFIFDFKPDGTFAVSVTNPKHILADFHKSGIAYRYLNYVVFFYPKELGKPRLYFVDSDSKMQRSDKKVTMTRDDNRPLSKEEVAIATETVEKRKVVPFSGKWMRSDKFLFDVTPSGLFSHTATLSNQVVSDKYRNGIAFSHPGFALFFYPKEGGRPRLYQVSDSNNMVRRDKLFSLKKTHSKDNLALAETSKGVDANSQEMSKQMEKTRKNSEAATQLDIETKFQLPGKFDIVRAGANGTMLFFLLKEKSTLLFFDVLKNKSVMEIPVVGNVAFAANKKHLVLFHVGSRVVERWNLKTLERELVKTFDREFNPRYAVMGDAGDGPMLVAGKELQLWNPETLTPIKLVGNLPHQKLNSDDDRRGITVSSNGNYFCIWFKGQSGQDYQVIKINPFGITMDRTSGRHGANDHWAMPNANGSRLFNYQGEIYGPDLEPIPTDQFKSGVLLPTQSEDYFVYLSKTGNSNNASIRLTSDQREIFRSENVPDVMSTKIKTDRGQLGYEPLVRFLPDHNRMIFLPISKSEVVIRKADIDESLQQEKQYLYITSNPAPTIKPDEKFSFQFKALSSSTVEYEMLIGPKGATVSPSGFVSWDPKSYIKGEMARFQIEAKNNDGVSTQIGFELDVDQGDTPLDVNWNIRYAKNDLIAAYAVEETVFALPGKFDEMRSGANGTLLFFLIREKSQLVAFDVIKQQIVKSIPVAGDVAFAANKTSLVIFRSSSHVAERWNLKTFEREQTTSFDRNFNPKHAAMGNAGDGPVLLSGNSVQLWDSNLLSPIQLFGSLPGDDSFAQRYGRGITVSADGKTFCHWSLGASSERLVTTHVTPYGVTYQRSETPIGGWSLPNADASQFFEAGTLRTRDLNRITSERFSNGILIPSQSPNYFLFIEGSKETTSVSICTASDFRVLHKSRYIPNFYDRSVGLRGAVTRDTDFEPPVRFLPDHDLFVFLPKNRGEVILRKIDLRQEVSQGGKHLFITSKPSSILKNTDQFEHQITTLSSSNVTFKLLSGPPGAEVTPTGLVSWKPSKESHGEIVNFQIEGTNEDAIAASVNFELEIDRGEILDVVDMDTRRQKRKGLLAKYAEPELEIQLTGKYSRFRRGKAGQILVFHLQDENRLTVVDTKLQKIVKEIPVSDATVFTANLNYLIVADPQKKSLDRYSLSTFAIEKSVPLNGDFPTVAEMGASGTGPLALWSENEMQLWDVESMTLRPKRGDLISAKREYGGLALSVSADGKTFCGWLNSSYANGFEMMRVGERSTSVVKCSSGRVNWIMSAPRGEKFYRPGARGLDTRTEFTTLPAEFKDYAVFPTLDSRFVIAIRKKEVVNRYSKQYSEALICSAIDLSILGKIDFVVPMTSNGHQPEWGRLNNQPRSQYYHDRKSFVYLPDSNDRVVFRGVNLGVRKTGPAVEYVNIISFPEPITMLGETFRYQLEALSHKKDVTYALFDGPDGMTVSQDGLVQWKVKERPLGGSVSVAMIAKADHLDDIQRFDLKIERNLKNAADPTELGFVKVDDLRLELPVPMTSRTIGLNRQQLLIAGNKLAILKPDGWSLTKAVQLKKEYLKIYERKDYFIAVSEKSKSVDILDKEKFEVIRTSKIDAMNVTDFATHPTLPLSYIAYKTDKAVPRHRFIVFDEVKMIAKDDNEWVGNWIAVDPNGQFLITAYSDTYRRGSRILINPTNWHIVPEYGSLGWLIRYQLNRKGLPTFNEAKQQAGSRGTGIRMSEDGRRVTYLSFAGYPLNSKSLGGFDPFNLRKVPVGYQTKDVASCKEFDFHPTLPLAVSPGSNPAATDVSVFFHREKGAIETDRIKIDSIELDGIETPKPYFSPDGKSLLIDGGINGIRYLHKIPLKLSAAELATNAEVLKKRAESLLVKKVSKIALADLGAFGGVNPNEMSKSSIARKYRRSVVMTRSRRSSGSGFVIGADGYILTCEHCVPDKKSIQVTYENSAGETETVDGRIVFDDPDADLAVIKISVTEKLQPVNLAIGKKIEIGEPVSVIGNPSVGNTILNHTMTEGIVSSSRRMIDEMELIQSNAEVNPGSSGGPMFDDHGQVIGIVVLKAKIEGAGFAIPVKTIQSFLLEILESNTESIQVVRNWYNSDGKGPLAAKIIAYTDQKITVERSSDKKRFTIDHTSLCEGDRGFIRFLEKLQMKTKNDKE